MELTTEQKARVFAMHYGSKVQVPHPWEEHPGQTATGYITGIREGTEVEVQLVLGVHAEEEPAYYDFETAKLLQRTLSAITDEDAIAVAKFCDPELEQFTHAVRRSTSPEARFMSVMYDTGKQRANECVIDFDGSELLYTQAQFLIQRGYDVPLFIAPGHPDNGKTAIEMGMAIDITSLPQSS